MALRRELHDSLPNSSVRSRQKLQSDSWTLRALCGSPQSSRLWHAACLLGWLKDGFWDIEEVLLCATQAAPSQKREAAAEPPEQTFAPCAAWRQSVFSGPAL